MKLHRGMLLMFLGLVLSVRGVGAMEIVNTCRYFGGDFNLGDSICLSTPQGNRLASCAMELNNPSWMVSKKPCPTPTAKKPRKSSRALEYMKDYIRRNVK